MNIKTIYISEVDSTNNYLARYPSADDGEMVVAWTDFQSAGRGCGSNSWESAAGKNLTFSVLVHPRGVPAQDQFILSMANALALKDTLSQYTDGISIKWPNDIYWNDCKICGTLIETTLRGSHIKDCIIGTGINVNQHTFLSDAPNPVSLEQILHREINREEVLSKVTDSIALYINNVEDGDWASVRKDYRASLYRKGGIHSFRYPDGKEEKLRYADVSNDGHLLLQRPDSGEQLSFAFKEIAFVV